MQFTDLSFTLPRLASLSPRLGQGLANAGLLGLWLWLYFPVFGYLSFIFSAEDFRTNQWLLLGVLALLVHQVRRGGWAFDWDAAPRLHWPALGLAVGGSLLYLAAERFLDVNTLSASLFGLASYGLLGLWLAPGAWRQGLPAALLLIGALPFGDHMQTFVGYPVRVLTAALVREGLAAAGIGSVGVDTILIFENGVSQVDLPCSGVKSLWTGGLFLLAATWVERRPFNARWALAAVAFAVLLLSANLARVGVLVVVGEVLGWRLLAEMLHVPLGVLGFVTACAAAVGLLRLQPALSAPAADPAALRPRWLRPALAAIVIGLALAYTPRPLTGLAQTAPAWRFPEAFHTRPLPLTPEIRQFLIRDGAEAAERARFEWRGLTGSLMVITSRTWRAHHRPERCFEVFGLQLEDSRTLLLGGAQPVRYLSLGDAHSPGALSALYWFQSTHTTTDDYGARIWADLAPERQRWALVSVVFDHGVDPNAPALRDFAAELHAEVAAHLIDTAQP